MKTRLAMLAVAAAAILCTACEKNDGGNILQAKASGPEITAFLNDANNGIIYTNLYHVDENGTVDDVFMDGKGSQTFVFTEEGAIYLFWEAEDPSPGGGIKSGCTEYRLVDLNTETAAFTFEYVELGITGTATLHSYSNGEFKMSGKSPFIWSDRDDTLTIGRIYTGGDTRDKLLESIEGLESQQ